MLVRICPRSDTLHLSHGYTVMATSRDGFVHPGSEHGLFVHEVRLLTTLRYFIDDVPPIPNVLSNVEQHSFLGYYIAVAPGAPLPERDRGSGQVPPESQQTLEMRIGRVAGEGLREDVNLTNFAMAVTRFSLAIEIETDPSLHAGFSRAPRFEGNRALFEIELEPRQSWHLRIKFWSAAAEPPLSTAAAGPRLQERQLALPQSRAGAFRAEVPGSGTLSEVVAGTLEQAARDLDALRLPDLKTVAAGLPVYVALFGRDTLTASWQAAMLGSQLMHGTLETLAKFQGTVTDDATDEQPGRMLHEAHTDWRGRNY